MVNVSLQMNPGLIYNAHHYSDTLKGLHENKMKRRSFIKNSGCLALSSLLPGAAYSATEQSNDRPLILGVFTRRNPKLTFKLFFSLAEYLSSALNREVKLESAKNFKQFWSGVKTQRYDIVHFNQYHYIISNLLYNYQVILKNEEFGNSTIAGAISVRKDSGIDTLQDLKNKTILFGGGKMAMQSYISAKWLLLQAGLHDDDYIEKIAINPPNAIMSTFNKQADAAGAGDIILRLKYVKNKIDVNEMKILAETQQLPHLPWAVKGDMNETLKTKIQQVLSSLQETKQGQAILKSSRLTALLPATDNDYNQHRKIITEVYGEDYGIKQFQ